jgi:tetratricopeptide (TPR) repeat protein
MRPKATGQATISLMITLLLLLRVASNELVVLSHEVPAYEAYNHALMLQQQDLDEEAISKYLHVISLKPDLSEAHNNLGFMLQAADRVEEAMQQYQASVSDSRADMRAGALSNIGNLLQRQAGADKKGQAAALRHFELALEHHPLHVHAMYNKANTLLLLGRHRDAIIAYRSLLELEPTHEGARQSIGNGWIEAQHPAVFGSMPAGTFGHALQALSQTPEFATAWLPTVGKLQASLQQLPNAVTFLRNAISGKAANTLYLYNLGRVLLTLSQELQGERAADAEDEAVAVFEQAWEAVYGDGAKATGAKVQPDLSGMLSQLYYNLAVGELERKGTRGSRKKARAKGAEGADKTPAQLARSYLEKALEICRRSECYAETEVAARNNLAVLLENGTGGPGASAQKDLRGAEELLCQALALTPSDVKLLNHHGMVMLWQGRPTAALQSLLHLLKLVAVVGRAADGGASDGGAVNGGAGDSIGAKGASVRQQGPLWSVVNLFVLLGRCSPAEVQRWKDGRCMSFLRFIT